MKSVYALAIVFLLLLAAYGCVYWWMPISNKAQLANEVTASLQSELNKADVEASQLFNCSAEDDAWTRASFSFFLIKENNVIAWSKNDFVPDLDSLQEDFSIRFRHQAKGDFILKKWKKPDGNYLLLVLPLQFEYGIVNDYLSPIRSAALPLSIMIDMNSPSSVCIKGGDQECLFKIISKDNNQNQGSARSLILFGLLLAITFLLMILIYKLTFFIKRNRVEWSFLILTIVSFSVRMLMVKANFPRGFLLSSLFDPTYYASSSFNASIADLLINSAVVAGLCLFLLFHFRKFKIVRLVFRLKKGQAYIFTSLCVFICYLSFLFPYLFVESIYHNSAISLELTDSLMFDGHRISAFISLLFGCISAYLFIHIFLRLALFIQKKSSIKFSIPLLFGAVAFLIFFIGNEKEYWIALGIGFIFLPIAYLSKATNQHKSKSFKTYVYLLLMIIAFSIECSLGVYKFNQEKKIESQFKFGNNYLVDQDILAEFLLHESAIAIAKDKDIKIGLVGEEISLKLIQKRIEQLYLNSYFERYEVSIAVFNDDSLTSQQSSYLENIKDQAVESNKSSFKDIYFINDPSSDTLKRYIALIAIADKRNTTSGYVVLDLSLKKVIPETVFPELLVDNRYIQFFKSKDFSYSLFSNNKISSSFGDFNYEKRFNPQWLGQASLYNQGIVDGGYRHVAIEYQPHRTAIITAPIYPMEFIVINFSFYIALGLMILLALLIVAWIVSFIKGQRLNYAARIQLYVYLAFFIPLLLVSLTTLRLIIISAENQKEAEYISKAKIVEQRISPILEEFRKRGVSYKNQLEVELTEMAKVASIDASIYSIDGKLITSSEPMIFENQLISNLIDRKAWQEIVVNNENYYVNSESIGMLLFNSVYYAIKSPITGEVMGILSIPFFESASSLEQTEINVVSAIVGVFSIAFILFSLLSYFAISGLIAPLKFITNALRKISLTGKNKPIEWKANDEIGLMANEYNRMLLNLEESKSELQKNQKEIAWREIAQQVAHEIKNPLTPMKLTLQQLELGLITGDVPKEKTQKSIDIMLKQVDILNEIASSFSAFATMPAPQIKTLDVTDLLQRTIGLFSTTAEANVKFGHTQKINVVGDEAILLRAFSNVILNGIQSKRANVHVEINISCEYNEANCIISIHDNGKGIDEELRDKVFVPHFTTKTTGAGLGLAIVKQTLELCGASIWFETEVNVGTTFFVQLPLVTHHN